MRLPGRNKMALIESAVLLCYAQLLVSVLPYALWSHTLGPIRESAPVPSHNIADTNPVQMTGWTVEVAARYLPWGPACLPRAMAMKWMLKRRNIQSDLCIGIHPPALKNVGQANLHAWLTVGPDTVSGGDVVGDFKLIARFGA